MLKLLPLIALAAIAPLRAEAACHFKTEHAVICGDYPSAAEAFQTFGFDGARMDKSYNSAILEGSGCGRAYRRTWKTENIRLMAKGRVPSLNGWVVVDAVMVNHRIGYVADAYIQGICERYVPPPPYVAPKDPPHGL